MRIRIGDRVKLISCSDLTLKLMVKHSILEYGIEGIIANINYEENSAKVKFDNNVILSIQFKDLEKVTDSNCVNKKETEMSLKSELHNGAVVEIRNGYRYIKIDKTFINTSMQGGYNPLSEYSENLNHLRDTDYDIVKINNNTNYGDYCYRAVLEVDENKWTWERQENILSDKEKEYLSAVIAPFRDKVESIEKPDTYIRINYSDGEEPTEFHSFKSDTMYKGMGFNKKYTLEELGL